MSFKVIDVEDASYQLLNLTGAVGIVVLSARKRVFQPVALNTFWALIAVAALVRIAL